MFKSTTKKLLYFVNKLVYVPYKFSKYLIIILNLKIVSLKWKVGAVALKLVI